jgi:integrase
LIYSPTEKNTVAAFSRIFEKYLPKIDCQALSIQPPPNFARRSIASPLGKNLMKVILFAPGDYNCSSLSKMQLFCRARNYRMLCYFRGIHEAKDAVEAVCAEADALIIDKLSTVTANLSNLSHLELMRSAGKQIITVSKRQTTDEIWKQIDHLRPISLEPVLQILDENLKPPYLLTMLKEPARSATLSLSEPLTRYINARSLKAKTAVHYEYHFRLYLSDWLDRDVFSLSHNECRERYSVLSGVNGLGTARYVFTVLSTVLRFAIARYSTVSGGSTLRINPADKVVVRPSTAKPLDVRIKEFNDAEALRKAKVERFEQIFSPLPSGDLGQMRKAVTVARVFIDYKRHRKLCDTTMEHYELSLCTYLSDWLQRPISSITRNECIERHRSLTEHRGPSIANYAVALFGYLARFAIGFYETDDGESILKNNPVDKLTVIRAWNQESANVDNFIRSSDLGKWFLGTAHLKNQKLADLYHVIIMTGLRLNEPLGLTWSNVDLKEGFLTVPSTKNGTRHVLPLSRQVFQILERRYQDRHQADIFVFPGCVPITNYAYGKSAERSKLSLRRMDFVELLR